MTTPACILDRAGFPMVWIDALDAYMHWYPVTKIQAEYFLCATPDSQFNEQWYDDLLYLNPRVTPSAIQDNNYWNAFLTGLLPQEAQRFAQWCDPLCSIPTIEEWLTAYRSLKAMPELPDALTTMGELSDRVYTLMERIESASRKVGENEGITRSRADQMLMRLGVMEWVACPDLRTRWGGMGKPAKRFRGGLFTPDHGQPHELLDPETDRASYYGLRLIRRG